MDGPALHPRGLQGSRAGATDVTVVDVIVDVTVDVPSAEARTAGGSSMLPSGYTAPTCSGPSAIDSDGSSDMHLGDPGPAGMQRAVAARGTPGGAPAAAGLAAHPRRLTLPWRFSDSLADLETALPPRNPQAQAHTRRGPPAPAPPRPPPCALRLASPPPTARRRGRQGGRGAVLVARVVGEGFRACALPLSL